MISKLIRCLCCCVLSTYSEYEKIEQSEHTQTIPYEMQFHLGERAKIAFRLLYGYVSRFKKFPWPKEIYLTRNLGEWTQQMLKLKDTDTLPLHQIRALGYIYKLMDVEVTPPYTAHQVRVLSCPQTLVNLWIDEETSARYILLWCFLKQYQRFPEEKELYFNFQLGIWYKIIQNDLSSATKQSLNIINSAFNPPGYQVGSMEIELGCASLV